MIYQISKSIDIHFLFLKNKNYLMKYIDYFFYKFYCIILKTGEEKSPQINSYLGIAGMLLFNIITVLSIKGISLDNNEVLGVFFMIAIIFYFMFIFKQRYLKIYSRFKKKDPCPRFGYLFVIIYIILSFSTLVLAGITARNSLK